MMNLKKITMAILATILVTFSVISVAVPPPLSDPDNVAGWAINTSVSDEFNGDTFDRGVWFNQGENGLWNGEWKGRAPSQFNPDNVSVANGFLTLTARWDENYPYADEFQSGNPTGNFKYGEVAQVTTAALLGKNYFLHGYMEMRSKAAPGPISSSYWTTGNGGETDAFESFGYNARNPWSAKRFHTSFHDWRRGSSTYGQRIWDNQHILDFNVADDFHTYGFEWDPEYVAIFIDGALINCVTRAEMGDAWVATGAQRPWIDMEIFSWEVPAADLTPEDFNGMEGIDFVVDYARVYQRTNGTSGGTCHAPTNLVANPSFENGMDNWTGGGETTPATSQIGSYSAALNGNTTIEQVVQVKPNTTYMLSAFANSSETNPSNNIWRNVHLGVRNYGGAQADVRYFFPHWHEKSLQFTTGEDTSEATIYFTNAPQGGLAYVDDIQLFEAELVAMEPQPNQAVTGFDLILENATVSVNEFIALANIIAPDNATNTNVLWSSNNEAIAIVSNGVVRGISQGNVTISATTEDGGFSDSTNISVVAESDNLVSDASFESSTLDAWTESRGLTTIVNQNVKAGLSAGFLNGNGALQQRITVEPSTSYTLTAWAKVGGQNQTAYVGIVDYGNDSSLVTSTSYTEHIINFITGADVTEVEIYLWNGDANHQAYFDDVRVVIAEPDATPLPSPTATPLPSPTATPLPSPTATPLPSPTATPLPSPTVTPLPSPTATPLPSPTATPLPSPTATPLPSPTVTPLPSPTLTPLPSPVSTPTPIMTLPPAVASPSPTPSPVVTSPTPDVTPTPGVTPTPDVTPAPTEIIEPEATPEPAESQVEQEVLETSGSIYWLLMLLTITIVFNRKK